jgi:hypothetical protein
MKDDPVPDADHIARYCGRAKLDDDGRPTGQAFRLCTSSQGIEPFLSVNWLEHLSTGARSEQIDALRAAFAAKERFKVAASARFAVHQVGELCDYIHRESPDNRKLTVLHHPEPDDPSHAALHGLKEDDDLIGELIAEVVRDTYPAKG